MAIKIGKMTTTNSGVLDGRIANGKVAEREWWAGYGGLLVKRGSLQEGQFRVVHTKLE